MTLRESVLAALRGEQTASVPFTCYEGLAPEGSEAINSLCFVSTVHVATVETEGVTITREETGPGRRRERMETPWGSLTREMEVEPGYGSGWAISHWIKRPEDYGIIKRVIREATVTPAPERFRAARERFGDRGVVLPWSPRTPLQRLWIEYTGIERLSYDLVDCPEAVEGVLDAMLEQSREIVALNAQSEAELVWLPDNITGEIAGTRLFERYLAPYYAQICEILLPAGKIPCCHMDGMLRQIADSVAGTPLPVIEAFTPPPDGNLSVAEAARAWPEKSLWLNFPSSVHLREPDEVAAVTRELVAEAGGRPGFAMGVTENIPASVGARSLAAIADALMEA